MEKFLIPQDKANHFIYGFLVFFLANLFLSGLFSFLAVCVIASLKEIVYDKPTQKGTSDYKDFIWTVLPSILLLIKSII